MPESLPAGVPLIRTNRPWCTPVALQLVVLAACERVADFYTLFELMWGVEDSLFVIQQGRRSTPEGESPIPEDQKVWRAFSPSGAYAGAIVLPPGVAQPYWIEPGRIIATQRDSLGVVTIVSYRLERPDQVGR